MGTEIFVLSYLVTPLIFLVSIGLLFKTKFPNAKAIIVLIVNSLFLGYFLLSGALDGYLLQAFLVGGFLLIPFQIVSLSLAYIFGAKLKSYIGCHDSVT
jgi:hypothetical protein